MKLPLMFAAARRERALELALGHFAGRRDGAPATEVLVVAEEFDRFLRGGAGRSKP
jgi:hypothetical protein